MITFLQLGKLGRLGNQLFQYAALRGLSLKNNYEFKLPQLNDASWHGQKCLLDKFNIKKSFLLPEDTIKLKYSYSEPDWSIIDKNFFKIPDNTSIDGFFQSLFYFAGFEDIIKQELTPCEPHMRKASNYIETLKSENNCEIVSVHVRRGDNMTNGQQELIKAYEPNGLYEQYFNKAKAFFSGKNVKFLVFTGGQRFNEDNSDDVAWCRNFFRGDEFIFSEGQDQIDDLCSIISCDHNILSHASSFGWWGAFLNRNPQKTVVAPEFYHPDHPNLIRKNFYPSKYILV
tara:strand:- start:1696 stop:2553 length:858 start_codon:yes stop_codon:yes gene_type:complete